jgi:hypothetical protein
VRSSDLDDQRAALRALDPMYDDIGQGLALASSNVELAVSRGTSGVWLDRLTKTQWLLAAAVRGAADPPIVGPEIERELRSAADDPDVQPAPLAVARARAALLRGEVAQATELADDLVSTSNTWLSCPVALLVCSVVLADPDGRRN